MVVWIVGDMVSQMEVESQMELNPPSRQQGISLWDFRNFPTHF